MHLRFTPKESLELLNLFLTLGLNQYAYHFWLNRRALESCVRAGDFQQLTVDSTGSLKTIPALQSGLGVNHTLRSILELHFSLVSQW